MEDIREDEEKNDIEEGAAGESKSDKFKRIAAYRVTKLRTGIANLGKLSNKASYEYSEEQVNKMFDTLEKDLSNARNKFDNSKEDKGFTF